MGCKKDEDVMRRNGIIKHEIRIVVIYHSAFSSFIKNDFDILSNYYFVTEFNCKRKRDFLRMITVIRSSDISFTWFAGEHAFLAVLFSKMFRKRAAVVAGGYDVAYAPEINYGQFTKGWHKRMITKFALKYADIIIPVSNFTQNEVLSNSNPRNMHLLYNGIDTNKFTPKGEKCSLVITVASGSMNVIRLKGLDTFVIAAEYIPNTEFAILGLSNKDMEILKALNPPKNVKLFGRLSQEELIRWYQKAKVYCQLSYRESFGMALAEAMSCECVPVVANRGALPEVVGDTGLYVPYKDPEATAEAIREALNNAGDLGKKARRRIIDMYNINKREIELIKLLQNCG